MTRVRVTFMVLLLCLSLSSPLRAAEGDVAELYADSFAAEAEGDYATALNKALAVLRARPADYTATLRAGWLYYLKGQYEDAVSTYRRAVELAPGAIEPRLGLMLPMMALYRWKETAALCQEVLTKAPANYLALSRLAYALYNQGEYAEALRRYDQALAYFPAELDMRLGRGWSYLKLGRRDEARGEFRHVLELSRDNVSARAGLDAL